MHNITLKGYLCAALSVVALSATIVFIYSAGVEMITALVMREDDLYFDPKLISAFLFIPALAFFDLFCLCFFLPALKRVKIMRFFQRLMLPVTIYLIFAFALGFLLALMVKIYPLNREYYKCHSTSIVSSGSRYAKSKEMCKKKYN